MPSYVLRCLRAQRAAAPAALQNFLDASYLGDGATPLRSWLEAEVARKDAALWTEDGLRELREAIDAGAL